MGLELNSPLLTLFLFNFLLLSFLLLFNFSSIITLGSWKIYPSGSSGTPASLSPSLVFCDFLHVFSRSSFLPTFTLTYDHIPQATNQPST
ncbi:hypothetical protein BDW59DRAFT_151982 [Aspergillus cavernicola]|uniref:Secreted protein n=1 Tax=Aspergillus cavernicola TaxID=176166 RepID=A0ABR4HSN1_9EURO